MQSAGSGLSTPAICQSCSTTLQKHQIGSAFLWLFKGQFCIILYIDFSEKLNKCNLSGTKCMEQDLMGEQRFNF